MAGAIQILTLVGDSYEVEFSDDYSLGDFKVTVEKKSGVTPIMQRLILGEKVLRGDSEKIVDLGVEPGSVVTLSQKRFPPPSQRDDDRVRKLMDADDFDGLQTAAEEGVNLDVNYGLYDILHTAAMKGDYDMVEMMLEAGTSPFAITRQNPKTALQVAAKYGKKDVCGLLIEWGLDPHEKNKMTSDGSGRMIETWDAVQYANGNKHPELGEWLANQPSPKPR